MKKNIKSLVILLVLITSYVIFSKQAAAQHSNISFQVFYDQLSPYGEWVDYPKYGYVWIPNEGDEFVPYSTEGHWVLTDYGWTWVSNYDWGWAPFHYGRWDYDNYYGWLWVPDTEWGPSWVDWRRADGYYGWSPMEPGISVNISFGRPYSSTNDHWMFVRDRDFERTDINHYYINQTDRRRIIGSSTVINTTYIDNSRHTTYVTGPARTDVQRVTGRQIKSVAIRENSRPGQKMNNGQLEIYRPQVNKNSGRENKPSKITNLKDVKRPSQGNNTTQPWNVNPQNRNSTKVLPVQQQRNATPMHTNQREQQQNTVRPENNMKVQSVKLPQRNADPANSNQKQPQNTVRPQNNAKAKSVQQQQINTTPANTNPKQQQPSNTRPQNNTKAQPVQQKPSIATPANTNQRQKQPQKPQNNVRQQNNNASPAQQPTAPANNNLKQHPQQNTRPQNNTQAQPAPHQRNTTPQNDGKGQDKRRND